MEKKNATILVVDDDQSMLDFLSSVLKRDYRVFTCKNRSDFYSILDHELVDLVVMDILLGSDNGLDLLREASARIPELEFIMMSVIKEPETVVKAIKLGAIDYITKDFGADEVFLKINNALKAKESKRKSRALETEKRLSWHPCIVSADDLEIASTYRRLELVYARSSFIFIKGENGSGRKTLVSQLRQKDPVYTPMVVYQPSSSDANKVIRGLFNPQRQTSPYEYSLIELAHNGILYIDNIDSTPYEFQEKIHSFIRTGSYVKEGRNVQLNVKVFGSVTAEPQALVDAGKLIPELLSSFGDSIVRIPPLRERKRDIELLAKQYLDHFAYYYGKKAMTFSEDARALLKSYPWGYNISELKVMLEGVVITNSAGEIMPEDLNIRYMAYSSHNLKSKSLDKLKLKDTLKDFERDTILKILRHFKGNRKKTASFLSLPYNTLKVKIRNYGIKDMN